MTARAYCGCNTRDLDHGHRQRTADEVEADLQVACRTVGSLAGAARIAARRIDRHALRATLEGLRLLLAEPFDASGEASHANP